MSQSSRRSDIKYDKAVHGSFINPRYLIIKFNIVKFKNHNINLKVSGKFKICNKIVNIQIVCIRGTNFFIPFSNRRALAVEDVMESI